MSADGVAKIATCSGTLSVMAPDVACRAWKIAPKFNSAKQLKCLLIISYQFATMGRSGRKWEYLGFNG